MPRPNLPCSVGPRALYIGVDLGTSGARAVAIDQAGTVQASGRAAFTAELSRKSPLDWWRVVRDSILLCLAKADPALVRAISVSATSGTVLALDANDNPLRSFMYDEHCGDSAVRERIANYASDWSPARGSTGGLACAIVLQQHRPARIGHQADWINFRLTGLWVSDSSNALKSGYDPSRGRWPDWIETTGMDMRLLPDVRDTGSMMGRLCKEAADDLGLLPEVSVIAGTTDGCASFLATGADRAGDAVTALGTTMTLKLLSDRPIFAPAFGVYSHKIGDVWLAGGASNSGGGALLRHFTKDQISTLSAGINPWAPTGLDYYPLSGIGERFPIANPDMESRTTPRPASDAAFLQALLEGIASVEATGYAKLESLGAPALRRLFTVGGGAQNTVWQAIRENRIEAAFARPLSVEAAYGAALLARRGMEG
jgi:sugar (pentulose or hexulose) kinase